MNKLQHKLTTFFILIFISPLYAQDVKKQFDKVGISDSQITKQYSIKGKIKGIPDGTRFYLIRTSLIGKADTIQNVSSKNETFVMIGEFELAGQLHFLKMDTTIVKLPSSRKTWESLIIDNSHLEISGDVEQWPNVIIKGSYETEVYKDFFKESEKANHSLEEANKNGQDTLTLIKARNEYKRFLVEYFAKHTNSYSTALFINQAEILPLQDRINAFDNLTDKIKQSFYGTQLSKTIKLLKLRYSIAPGNPFPELKVQSINGEIISIKNIAKKNKFTLIDFWASWCVPCREEIPNMLSIYNEYKTKGFGIIGISVDKEMLGWGKALKEDKTTWDQTIDIDQEALTLFGIKSIPAYVLLDNYGKMIVFQCAMSDIPSFGGNIRGDNLRTKIKELIDKSN